MRRRFLQTITTFILASLVLATSASAASADVMARWEMNEGSGSVMRDSSGKGLHGDIGSQVRVGVSTPSGRGYQFRRGGGINDEKLVQIPDDARLDPGIETYAVTIRVKTGSTHPNILQKGQQTTRGGMWKFEINRGWPRCHFRDGNGNISAVGFVNSKNPDTKLSDGQWHTVRCERLDNGVRITMDYGTPNAITRLNRKSIGRIDNSYPLTIGGKVACDGEKVGCDYFTGVLDWVRIDKGF